MTANIRSISLSVLLLSVTACGAVAAGADARSAVRPIADLDLERYQGTWYEIARLPNRFQEQCAGTVTATYSLRDDGRVDVINRCRLEDGSWDEARGVARRADPSGPASRLEVRFAPAWLSFLPAVWGDYWVLELDPGYRWALIGEPGRRYLWVLSRTPEMDSKTLADVLKTAERQGYDLEPLIRTPGGGIFESP